MTENRVSLALHDGPTEGWATLTPDRAPMWVGDGRGPVDLICPACGCVLACRLWERSILDVLVRCPECSRLLCSRSRRPGEPVPNAFVLMPDGRYEPIGPLKAKDDPVTVVGRRALDGYVRETGRPPARPLGTWNGNAREMTRESIHRDADSLVEILGDRYAELVAVDQRGRSSKTPPEHRHRVVELIEALRATAEELRESPLWRPITIQGDPLAEGMATVEVCRRWSQHPAWPELLETLVDDVVEPQHTIMLLASASFLVDVGNGVGVHGRSSSIIPDLWIQATVADRMEVEVKTPQSLRSPGRPLGPETCDRIIDREYKRSKEQLAGALSAMLVIGGFHLGSNLDALEAAANGRMRARVRYRPHWTGIILVDVTYENKIGPEGVGGFFPAIRTKTIGLEGYRGPMTMTDVPAQSMNVWDFMRPV